MERLTKRGEDDSIILKDDNRTCKDICENNGCNECTVQKAFNKLASYECLEELCILENGVGLRAMIDKFGEFIDNIEKYNEYEDLEEKGMLLKLPCKAGDTVYRINKGAKENIIKMRVLQVHCKQLHKNRTIIRIDAINDKDMGESSYFLEDFGKRVFLTKEEAEQALKQMGSEK